MDARRRQRDCDKGLKWTQSGPRLLFSLSLFLAHAFERSSFPLHTERETFFNMSTTIARSHLIEHNASHTCQWWENWLQSKNCLSTMITGRANSNNKHLCEWNVLRGPSFGHKRARREWHVLMSPTWRCLLGQKASKKRYFIIKIFIRSL